MVARSEEQRCASQKRGQDALLVNQGVGIVNKTESNGVRWFNGEDGSVVDEWDDPIRPVTQDTPHGFDGRLAAGRRPTGQ